MKDNLTPKENITDIFNEPTRLWFSETFNGATKVQEESWPAIMKGHPVLVSAPTGTGKTLSAFLVFIDRLKAMARSGDLEDKLYLIYISPLKSLAGDIRENLNRPLNGISEKETELFGKATRLKVAIRTGDTSQSERQKILRRPPHILIITPESLYLMLTGNKSQGILKTTQAIIIDELHALIDTKRGAHLMLSIARLDMLCDKPVQRVGLSATIRPLDLAADYLAPNPYYGDAPIIVSPIMEKKIKIEVKGTIPLGGRRRDPVWEELAREVFKQCQGRRSVIAFAEARRFAEKLAYFVNELGGDGFARVHHGSLSKEKRLETEVSLRNGTLRLLCATSSMELGIDVGEIDEVLQIGCPRTVSGTMQRLGRAGHNPGRVSYMYMYPRTASEGLFCGMTAEMARRGGVETACPPLMCFDVLAQHLVSMALSEYTIDDVMELLKHTYSFRDVSKEDVKNILCMLAGDYEHSREIPVRPRVLYDRLHERVSGDNYSRMLAVAAGGTIPDKGLFAMKTVDGVHIGELDEEFVFEVRVGEKIVLGSFAWRISQVKKDVVIVEPTSMDGARLPFWKGEIKGRSYSTSIEFAKMFGQFDKGIEEKTILKDLAALGLNESAAESAADFLQRQKEATGGLPDDKTIIVEHFTDHTGCHQIMVHALFGKQINTPLALLMQYVTAKQMNVNIGCVDEEDGFLLYPYGEEALPEGLIFAIAPKGARRILEAMLPTTQVFSLTFRYNAGRALMMGMKNQGRQPLWLQRLKSTEMLDSLREEGCFTNVDHPLIRETKRECLEELWDIDGLLAILNGIHSGVVTVREVYTEIPSPLSLPLQWQVEAAEMYQYFPTTNGMRQAVNDELKALDVMKPAQEELDKQMVRTKYPDNAERLHTLLMIEGDLLADELRDVCRKENVTDVSYYGESEDNPWIKELAEKGQITYIEPGLWIAAEHLPEYSAALGLEEDGGGLNEALKNIVRRMLYYRGAMIAEQISERYFLSFELIKGVLSELCDENKVICDDEVFYHSKRYTRAQKATIFGLRASAVTRPCEAYAAMMASRVFKNASPTEQLEMTIKQYVGASYPAIWWESVIFPQRVKGYRENMLDQFLASGEYFWRFGEDGRLIFAKYGDIDWNQEEVLSDSVPLTDDEGLIYKELKKRGASFMQSLNNLEIGITVQEGLLSLAEKGLVCADSFLPVRQWLSRDKLKKASPRSRVNARVMALSTGRWDVVRPLKGKNFEDYLWQLFDRCVILCRETYCRPEGEALSFGDALAVLRIWEYTGRVRRGYFIAGMSGAQFIRASEYDGVMTVLNRHAAGLKDSEGIVWLNAVDPAQVWGKALAGKDFMNVPGTLVGLHNGVVRVVFERQGKVLRVLDKESDENLLLLMSEFISLMKQKKIYPEKKRLTIKEYPKEMEQILKNVGFYKEMMDYVWYV